MTPKRVIILCATAVVVLGGGGFVAYTAYQNSIAPAPENPLTLGQLAGLLGGGDPFASDPATDQLKNAAVEKLRRVALKNGRDPGKLSAIVVPEQAPGGEGFMPANFPPGSNPSPGSNKQVAKSMLASFGFGGEQWGCLESLWHKESGWNERAMNRYSGAYGIPQSLPGSKMASAGGDWQTNAATQIKWGLGYIKNRYATPCGAWGHSQATGWY